MERNIELLERTMQHILDHPETHRQGVWACGSQACFAGWACKLSGLRQVDDNGRFWNGVKEIHAKFAARLLLGLTSREANLLFSGHNKIDQLQDMVKKLVNGEDLVNGEAL